MKGNLFAAVFDFKDLTGVFFLVIDDHVKLASLKLQFENTVILVGRLHGFQQHNIFHHPAADFFKDAARDLRFIIFAERRELLILQQGMDKCLSLTISHSRLCEENMFHWFNSGVRRFNGTIHNQLQRGKILLNLYDVSSCDTDGLLLLVPDIQQFHQTPGDRLCINGIQRLCALFGVTLFPQICGSEPQVMGKKIIGQH